MGIAEQDPGGSRLIIRSHLVTYGNGADEGLTDYLREEIETLWNEPKTTIALEGRAWIVEFRISAQVRRDLQEEEVYRNLDPRNNYFRIEEYARGNISFVDGLGCNSGYFKLENLYRGSTTAAHEYGHTLGLDHPRQLDIRGQGRPGIMYPRGTLVDPPFQYDPAKPAGTPGGTLHPMHRRVLPADIMHLRLDRLRFRNGQAIVGDFTNRYHFNHADLPPGFQGEPIPVAG